MNREDARYVIKELEFMSYYSRKAGKAKEQLNRIQQQIDDVSSPKSPQGHENIGAGRSLTFDGNEAYLNLKFTQQKDTEKEYKKWNDRFVDAQIQYYTILDQTDEKDFVRDYFSKKYSMTQIEEMYNTTRASRKIIQIVMNAL